MRFDRFTEKAQQAVSEAKALAQEANETKRAALAHDIWGRSASALLPMVREFEDLARQAADAIIFTPEQIAAAEKFKDEMTKLNMTLKQIAISSGFVEWLADVADRLNATIKLLQRAPQEGEVGTGRKQLTRELVF